MNDVEFLIRTNLQPGSLDVDVARAINRWPAEGGFKECFRGADVTRCEGKMCEAQSI
jgi:hypothetical protein